MRQKLRNETIPIKCASWSWNALFHKCFGALFLRAKIHSSQLNACNIPNLSKFHDNSTVNESRIVVLLRQFWVSAGKEKVAIKRVFLTASTSFRNSQWRECSEMSFNHGAQISQRSNGEWVRDHHFSEISLVVYGKKKGFWEEERGKWNWEKEEALSVWKLT